MKKFVYIIQEYLGGYDYTDVIQVDTPSLARKYRAVLATKYPTKIYRIVRYSLYV